MELENYLVKCTASFIVHFRYKLLSEYESVIILRQMPLVQHKEGKWIFPPSGT
jgi:hypothetical protein